MAKCLECGVKIGAFQQFCSPCVNRQLAAEEKREVARIKAEREAQRAARVETEAWVEEWKRSYIDSIQAGRVSYAYMWLYLPVDSQVDNDTIGTWDMTELERLGLQGWKVVTVIPKTIGVALKNLSTTGTTWGAGMGGNVYGVYLILERQVRADDEQALAAAQSIGEALLLRGISV
jgi:hypothetical protein